MKLIITIALRAAVPILKALYKPFKIFRSERGAALDPESVSAVDEEVIEAAIRRMAAGQLDDSLVRKFVNKVTGSIATPDFLKSPNVITWLAMPEVKENLRKAVSAKVLGVESPAGAVNRLEAIFVEISLADFREGKGIVEVVIAVLSASIKSQVSDQGTAGLISASHSRIASDLEAIKGHLQVSSGEGIRTLDMVWSDWAEVTIPPLDGSLFGSAIETSKRTVLAWLAQEPARPLLITADSTEEALAFVSQLFGRLGGTELSAYREQAVIVDKSECFLNLVAEKGPFIPIVFSRDVERELAIHVSKIHSIVIYPRNAVSNKPDIILEPAGQDTFNKALENMGKTRDDILRLSSASGRSLTVLRRKLSTVPVVQVPVWAKDTSIASSLIPFLLVGAWDTTNQADKTGLALLSDSRTFDDLEKEIQSICQLNDAPVWSIGTFRGVVSKIDLLYAIAGVVTVKDIERYFTLARTVLGEDDPSLDLEEDQRWAASIHGKTREFSNAFRQGISETLVLFAVHGQQLFDNRLGVQTNSEVVRTIRELLPTPLATRDLESNDRDLPTYAEAAPDEFLSIIERDLNGEIPAVFGLLRPVSSGMFGRSPSRTGLLWALEGLAWAPSTLPRVTFILARLAQIEINDNWLNKPAHSLESIFRSWMPQTAASLEDRIAIVRRLADRFPDVAWKLAIAQFGMRTQLGEYTHKPRWRTDGYGFGEPLEDLAPRMEFVNQMAEMVLSWHTYSVEQICDLVDLLAHLSEENQARAWGAITGWAEEAASDEEKAIVREKVRVVTLSPQAIKRANRDGNTSRLSVPGRETYTALEPSDIVCRHSWLFRNSWVTESADDLDNIEDMDFQAREERIQEARIAAIREVFECRGIDGIFELAKVGEAAWIIGGLAAGSVLEKSDLQQLLGLALSSVENESGHSARCKNLARGIIRALPDNMAREESIKAVIQEHPEIEMVDVLLLSNFSRSTWELVDTLSTIDQEKYWANVTPEHIYESPSECEESIDRLLSHGRPRAAFSGACYLLAKISPEIIQKLLWAIVQPGKEQEGQYLLKKYHIQEAFKKLNESGAATFEQMARLEFAYIEILGETLSRHDENLLPNLESYVGLHPEFFIQAVCWVYKRTDDAEDPIELRVPEEQISTMRRRGVKLFQSLRSIPGLNDQEAEQGAVLLKWVSTVRDGCRSYSREGRADYWIGELLAHSPIGKDSVWPCESVREVIEQIHSEEMVQGTHIGVFNRRGVHYRGEGGAQERELAEKYRGWSDALKISHPFVSSHLLQGLASNYERDAVREDTTAEVRRRLH
ncbi:hypothetical protein [uncultured Pseudomonas sp.]|uniref:hypothetical protein n=1 Tax=uncultured Pseudomonas sp. TaxID=114707 RepID=UPI002584DDC1|nr:hypothetical protein [uncultured Pseudomonas sp.]